MAALQPDAPAVVASASFLRAVGAGGTISCIPGFFGRIGDADYLRRKTDLTTEIEAVRYSTDS